MRFITIGTLESKEAEALARYRASQKAMQKSPAGTPAPRRSGERQEVSPGRDHVGQPVPRGSRLSERETAAAERTWITYTVQRGDNLQGIAEWFYGDRDRWGLIYAANRALIPDPKAVDAGVVLMIPRRRESTPLA